MKMTGLFTPTSLFLSLLPAESCAGVADPSCNRMPGWTITLVRLFADRNKAFPGGPIVHVPLEVEANRH